MRNKFEPGEKVLLPGVIEAAKVYTDQVVYIIECDSGDRVHVDEKYIKVDARKAGKSLSYF